MGANDALQPGTVAPPVIGPAVLVVNTRSRRGHEWYELARRHLTDYGVELEHSLALRDPKAILEQVRLATKRKTPLIVVGGGDGTMSAVARHFVGSESVLGVLPLGTGNAFARDMSIPADVRRACEIIVKGRTVAADLGVAGDDYFVNVATVGLTTAIASELTNEAKRRLGRMVYAFALVRALSKIKPFHASIKTPHGDLEFDTLQVVIGNGRYHAGPFPLSPDASITEGRLTIYGLATISRAAFFRLALYLRTGRHVDLPEVHAISTTGGKLETKPSMRVTVDGEIAYKTPIGFGVAPGALRVRAPMDFPG